MKTNRAIRHLCIALLTFCLTGTAFAVPEFEWIGQIGGTGDARVRATTVDARDDIIVVGSFENTISLDATTSLTASDGSDIFVGKYSPGGTLLWARRFGGSDGEWANAVMVDDSRHIYIAGGFNGDLTIGATPIDAINGSAFFARLNADGVPVWVRQAGSTRSSADAIARDALGNIYIAGGFASDPGDPARFGDFSLLCGTRDCFADGYIARYSPDGTRVSWVRHLQNGRRVFVTDIAVATDVYVTGQLNAAIRLDGTLLANFLSPTGMEFDALFLKLSGSTGSLIDGHVIGNGGIGWDRANGVAVDGASNAIVTGHFYHAGAEFGGLPTISAVGDPDLFVAQYGAAGAFTWVDSAGGLPGGATGWDVALDGANPVIAGDFHGSWDFHGTSITADSPIGPSFSDVLVARYRAEPVSSRGWEWVRTAGGPQNDSAYTIAVDSRKDIVLGGTIGEGTARFGTMSVSVVGSVDGFVTKLSEPVDPLPDDPFDDDPRIDRDWNLIKPWECYNERVPRPCPLVLRDNFIDYPAETVWQLRIDGLNLTSADDIDRYVLPLPNPAATILGDRYADIAGDPPADPTEPLQECHGVEREVPGPDPVSVRTIRVTTYGTLMIDVIPSGPRPVGLAGENVVVDAGAVEVGRAPATTVTSVSCPRSPPYDPRDEERPPDRTSVNVTIGEREGRRARSAIGTYSLEFTYRIRAIGLTPPPWVIDQMEARGIRQLGDIFCLRGGGRRFPRCDSGPSGTSVIDFLHPGLADIIFNCFADGPGCWDIRELYWPETETPFDVQLSANEDVSFTLFDDAQNVVTVAAASDLQQGVDTPFAFNKRISQSQLAAGRYFLVTEGKPTSIRMSFSAPQEIGPPVIGDRSNLLWLLVAFVALVIVGLLLINRTRR